MKTTATLIQKEDIPNYTFRPVSQAQAAPLAQKLMNAEKLGNGFKSKSTIVFETNDGPKKVQTTVWAVSEKFIQLKNGVHIPLASLIDIDY